MNDRFLIVIVGPTAVGKTSLAIDCAHYLNTEIISADSRQFFREMNIGTAKPTDEELKQVKHHFINSLSIADEYNAGIFERDALKVLEKIFGGSGRSFAVMAGGSGLYIHAVCDGFDEVPQANKEIRAHLERQYKENGVESLQALLKKYDEEHYTKADIKNPHRVMRAIEVCMLTGKKYSELRTREGGRRKKDEGKRQFKTLKIGIALPREKLYERINARVDTMMSDGLLEEVNSLQKFKHLNSLQTVGYKELFDFMEGKISLASAVAHIKQNTRNFAKRQMTWFRKDKEIKWFDAGDKENILQFVKMTTHS